MPARELYLILVDEDIWHVYWLWLEEYVDIEYKIYFYMI